MLQINVGLRWLTTDKYIILAMLYVLNYWWNRSSGIVETIRDLRSSAEFDWCRGGTRSHGVLYQLIDIHPYRHHSYRVGVHLQMGNISVPSHIIMDSHNADKYLFWSWRHISMLSKIRIYTKLYLFIIKTKLKCL